MSILSTNNKLVRVGAEYSAGPNIDIQDCVISGKDWTNEIAEASANAYNAATAQIPDPFDPTYLSAQIDNKLNSSDFTTWQNGQYTTDLQTIEGQINNKLDTSSFSDVSGSFLTAHQSLEGYATEDWVTAQGYITGVDLSNYYTKDETSGKEELAQAFSDIPIGDPEVNAYVTNNSATLNGTTDLVQNSSGLWNDVAVYQSNSANYLTAHQDISYKLDESAFADVSGTFLTAHQDLSNYYTTAEADSLSSTFSAAIDYVSANAGSDIVLENTPTGSQNIYTVSSETTALRIKGNEVIDVTNSMSGIYLNVYYNIISGVDGRYEIPFTVSANAAYPDAKTLFYLNTSDNKNGGFKASVDTSGNSNASGFALNIVDSNDNIVSINSIRNVWGFYTLPNCPVDVSTDGYNILGTTNPISAELAPGDYKIVISSIDAELVPSFSGWYYITVNNRGSVPVSSAPYISVPDVKLVDSKIDLLNTNLSSNGGIFVVDGHQYDLTVGYGSHLSAINSCSALFTNGSNFINTNNNFISGDGFNGFVTSSNYHVLRVESNGKISANNNASAIFTNGAFISADYYNGLLVTAGGRQVNLACGNGYALQASASNYFAWIDYNGVYGLSAANAKGSFGCYQGGQGSQDPIAKHYINGVGFSAGNTEFGVYNGGTLIANNFCKVTATNGCSALFTNASRTEITNAHTLLVGNNELGTMNGIIVSGNGNEFIKIYNGGSVKAVNGAELNLSGVTNKIGTSLNASGSQFVSADGEGVSAWKVAPMTVMGAYNQTSSNAAFVIGNGSAATARSDLFVIDYSGNAQTNDFIAGNGAKLSDSIQTSELEFNADNAITAIAGSAIGGGGVTGEFVPQSAFDELKQSYDALSSLFATYSGQWLLPNEGEE